MQTTETTTDFATMARAETLARVIHGLTADGDARPAFEQAKRVAQAVRTDRQRAILWSHQTLNHEAVTWEILIVLGVDQLGAQRVVRQGGRRRAEGHGSDDHENERSTKGTMNRKGTKKNKKSTMNRKGTKRHSQQGAVERGSDAQVRR